MKLQILLLPFYLRTDTTDDAHRHPTRGRCSGTHRPNQKAPHLSNFHLERRARRVKR